MNQLAILAVSAASVIFPAWQKLEPVDLLNPPQEVERETSYGFPTYKNQSPLPTACAIYELDKIIGYRLTC